MDLKNYQNIENRRMGVRQTFIKNLRYYRKQAGLTQEKLAEIIGMNTSYIGAMEAADVFHLLKLSTRWLLP